MKTLYDVLGVSHRATAGEIKSSFRKKSLEHHPDVNDDPWASQQFRIIYYAYLILGNPELRNRYDEKLKTIGQEMVTLYDVLEVKMIATYPEVRKSFHKLVLETHPDITNNDDAQAFRMIYYANSILSDEDRRLQYNAKIAQFGLI